MRIMIIGSTSYRERMIKYQEILEAEGHEVRRPKFDDFDINELDICIANIEDIKWSERVDILWDQRSTGTIFDFGAVVALQKPIKIVYLNPKTFTNVMLYYEAKTKGEPYGKRSEEISAKGPHIL